MKEKVLYLGHEYHIKTKSTDFLKEMLEEQFDVTYEAYNPYEGDYKTSMENVQDTFDYLICFQIMPAMSELKERYHFKKGILFPMYDATVGLGDDWWDQYRNFVIISFSKTLTKKLRELGIFSYYIQYFPQPVKFKNWGDENGLFFWQRRENISLRTLKKIMPHHSFSKIHLHKAMDPEEKFEDNDLKLYSGIETSEWVEDKKTLQKLMEEYALYMAPRQYEGIGMSFLEAMAMGRCVIAPDNATMNEYIFDGYNGYLYNNESLEAISIKDIRNCQKNAFEYISNGHQEWLNNKEKIIQWIKEDIPKRVTVITFTENNMEDKVGLKRTMESVHRQSYTNIEHIVIDNDSFDGTWELIERYRSWGWVKYHHFTEYVEEADLLKKAMEMATGEYVVFLKPGDFLLTKESICECKNLIENENGAEYLLGSFIFHSRNNLCIKKDGLEKKKACCGLQPIIIKMRCLKLFGPFEVSDRKNALKWLYNRLFDWQIPFKKQENPMIVMCDKNNTFAECVEVNHPLITIVTVAKDVIRNGREKQFRQSLESVHMQTYQNIEHLIIDGDSKDGTQEIIKEYASKGWITYISEPDMDVWDAMRKAVDLSKGEYINYLNTDDYFSGNYAVEKAVEIMEKENADYFYSEANRIARDKKGNEFVEHCDYFGNIDTVPFGKGYCHQSLYVRKDVIKELDTFNSPYRFSLDNYQMLQLIVHDKKGAYLPEHLVCFREGGLSAGEKTRDVYAQYFYDCIGKSFGMTLNDCWNLWVFKCFEEYPLHYCIGLSEKIKRGDWKKTYFEEFLKVLKWAEHKIQECDGSKE